LNINTNKVTQRSSKSSLSFFLFAIVRLVARFKLLDNPVTNWVGIYAYCFNASWNSLSDSPLVLF